MITVHHLNNSRSQRVLWALEELKIPYQVKHYERDPKTNLAPEQLKQVHPLGKSPVITDGEKMIAESGAIIEYLSETYGDSSFIPAVKSSSYWQYKYWLHFSEGTMMPQLLLALIFKKIVARSLPFIVKPIAKGIAKKVMDGYVLKNIGDNLALIEIHLKENEWFAGDTLTGADIQMSFPLEAWASQNKHNPSYPTIIAYVKRIQNRPAYQKALQVGGAYDYANI
ncbi:glutathione S-transferase family protein [Colwellia sp. RSH04]|uniref:glutathione S-transferase family protein n=1 Tax=Colwellia sp. RSH04 TaxID=2305464 RepID=UPI000E58863F|nr:glutathione S-transferase [Colwellia sp. RSH04]RHW76241.1 glutathione S-transferase [Colwellia sp. RSH04]